LVGLINMHADSENLAPNCNDLKAHYELSTCANGEMDEVIDKLIKQVCGHTSNAATLFGRWVAKSNYIYHIPIIASVKRIQNIK